jgi:hypothetical protein
MNLQERIDSIDKLQTAYIKEIYDTCHYLIEEGIINKDDNSILYELSEEDRDDGSSYFVTINGRKGIYEGTIETIYKNGTIQVYINDTGDVWDITVDDLYDLTDKLTYLTIINNK